MTDRRRGEADGSDLARRIAALSPEKRALLEARLGTRQAADATQRAGQSTAAPLSFAQERIYKLARADSESSFFVSVARLRLPSSVGLPALRAALASIVQRHDALRSEIAVDQDRPALVVRDAGPDGLLVADPGEGRGVEQMIADAANGVRALAPPLFRALAVATPGAPLELILVSHAIICDGPSLAIVRRELLSACLAHGQGRPLELPPVRTRPADHAREQRRRLHGARIERLVERWRHLEVAPNALALHTDWPRAPRRLPEVARCACSLSAARVSRARDVAHALGVSAAALWTAVASIVLSRFARQTQVVIGVLVSNRARLELQDFVGVAASAVPVNVDLAADVGCRAVAAHADAELRAAAEAEELPLDKLTQELRLPRSDRHHPLCQVVLGLRSELEPAPAGQAVAADAPDEADARGWLRAGSVHFDLAISVDDASPAPGVELLYDAHLFTDTAVRAIAQSLEVVLEAAIAEPDAPASRLPLVRGAERDEHVRRAAVPPPAFASTIHGLFERRAALDPHRTALQGDEAVSYAELNGRANRLARALIARGVRRGDTIGVCMKRSVDLITSFLAILKAGAVYLPLDPLYPPERLAFMLQDSGATVVLQLAEALDPVPPGCDAVDLATLDTSAYPGADLAPSAAGREPAYLMYTSGSTGRPKGVVVQHLGVCHVADAQVERLGLTADDQILQFASPSFDASIFEMVMAPRSGGALHLARAEDLMPGPPLVQLLKARRITVLTMPPSALGAVPPIELPDLRIVVAAGEACPAELVARWAPGRRFFNAYGPTEASIWATVTECAPAERPPSIGAPLPHVRARVVDDQLRPVPVGAPGELLLGGPGVALGYLNLPELTAERFLEPAEPGDADGRWYRTGDLVRRDSAGALWHLQRIDRQVKVRGFRIEPGEIEACLLALPGVRSAAVEVEHSNLVAYYVAAEPVDAQAIQRALVRQLPRHMVPTAFIALPAMPLSSNGKLDRAALQRQSRPRPAGLQPPRTPTEETLLEIWKSVLRIEQLGVDDNFFELGGHSLLAASVISRAAAALGRELPLRVMFRSPTIAQLAQAFDAAAAADEGAP